MTFDPIPTFYAGCHFRSRIEARWAVFLDHLDVKWWYESEGHVLDDGSYYLPDFYLPDQELWLEVKGQAKWSDADIRKWALFQNHPVCDHRTALLVGYIPDPRSVHAIGASDIDDAPSDRITDGIHMNSDICAWCVCPACGRVGIEYNARGARICSGTGHTGGDTCGRSTGDKSYSGNHPRLLTAYAAARSARFEHGEQG